MMDKPDVRAHAGGSFSASVNAARLARPRARLAVWLLCCLACCLLHAPPAEAGLAARAVILINMDTGKVLFEKNADTSIPPASLTKVMTSYLALDAVKAKRVKLNEKIRITRAVVTVGGSSMRLRAGERVEVSRLLTGMAVASGNDAATAVARRVGGNERQFVQSMNQKARALGLRRTTFKNPTGLPAAGQKTTARDMAQLSLAYLRTHKNALHYHGTRFMTHGGRQMRNTNALLGRVAGVTGLKTGWTVASGYNLIVTATRGKTRMLAVVLGGRSRDGRDLTARKVIEAGFRHPAAPKKVLQALGERPPKK